MSMTFFKPLNLCIFALVSSIVIYKIKQQCANKHFVQVASHKIDPQNEYICTSLDIALHKVSGKVIVCVALQTSKQHTLQNFNHYVAVYEFDQNDQFKVKELARIKSKVLQVT